jgi:hypothetical protein
MPGHLQVISYFTINNNKEKTYTREEACFEVVRIRGIE